MISDFLKPPTDNLYKFMAVSGLLMLLLFFVFMPWSLQRAMVAKAEAESSFAILKIDTEDIARKKTEAEATIERLQNEQVIAENRIAELQGQRDNKSHLQSPERALELNQMIAERDNRAKLIREIWSAINEAIVRTHKSNVEHTSRVKLASWQWKIGTVYGLSLFLLSLFGAFLTLKGFSLWFDRVQILQDAILRKQLTSELARKDSSPREAKN